MASCHSHLSCIQIAAFFIICLAIYVTKALSNGFSVELIHRDSVKSPFFNATETPHQRIINGIKRSISRANHFYPSVSKNSTQSMVYPDSGEYLMIYSVGRPPFKVFGIVDTGSELIWLQCKPCLKCYSQKDSIFDPSKSKSYRDFPCHSKQCHAFENSHCSGGSRGICKYSYEYGDRSYTKGNVASETITLGSISGRAISFPRSIIGCGHDNEIGISNSKCSGIVGLGGGALSLITQMGSSIAPKFSYCLIQTSYSGSTVSSKLNFGENAVVSGVGSMSTALVSKEPDTYYYLTLEGFSIGRKRLDFVSEKQTTKEGNVIIDSGTTLTILPDAFYMKLESEVAAQIKANLVKPPDPILKLCYESTSDSFDAPIITVHFRGADVKLNSVNTFVRVSGSVVCFAFTSLYGDAVIYGNLAQMNFLVGYDLQKGTVTFMPTDCTKA